MNLFQAIVDVQRAFATLAGEVERIKWAQDHSLVHGPITHVDAEKQVCRIQVGEDDEGNSVLSPWVPYGQTAGKRKVHSPPSVGQQMTMLATNGDHQLGVLLPFTWSDKNPSPSKAADQHVDTIGKTRTTLKDSLFKQEVDGVTESLSKQSRSLTIHKDEQNPATVDDEHPWEGNKADALHSLEATKDGGFAFKVKIGNDQHEIKFHPDTGVTHSVNGGQHEITIHPQNGIKHKSAQRVTIEAPQIQHSGDLMVSGSIHSGGTVQSLVGLIGPQIAGVPGVPPNANTW